jgi:protein subunit release factor B
MKQKGEKIVLVSKKDLEISWFSGSNGGQHQNRHMNCCRIHHPPSGVTCVGTKEKSAYQNQKAAFTALTSHPKFKAWLKFRLAEVHGQESVEDKVAKQMLPHNLRVECLKDGQWVEFTESETEFA